MKWFFLSNIQDQLEVVKSHRVQQFGGLLEVHSYLFIKTVDAGMGMT